LTGERSQPRVGPIELSGEAGGMHIGTETSMPWSRYVMAWRSFMRATARDAAATSGIADLLHGFLVSLGKSKSAESLPPHVLDAASGDVSVEGLRTTLLPLLIMAIEYETTFELTLSDWAFGNTKTFYPGHVHGKDVNSLVARRPAAPDAANFEHILFATSGRPEKPVMLLCSDHDIVVPSFHCTKYARDVQANAGNFSKVETLHSTQAQHLRFTHEELSTAIDRIADLAEEAHVKVAGDAAVGVARPWLDAGVHPGATSLNATNFQVAAAKRWQEVLHAQAQRLREREVSR